MWANGVDCKSNEPCENQVDSGQRRRQGLATLDYVLVLGVILPLAVFLFRVGPKIIRLAYEMVCV